MSPDAIPERREGHY